MIQWLFKFYFEFNDATNAGVLGFTKTIIYIYYFLYLCNEIISKNVLYAYQIILVAI